MSKKILVRKTKNKIANLVLIKKGYDIVNFFVPYFETKNSHIRKFSATYRMQSLQNNVSYLKEQLDYLYR